MNLNLKKIGLTVLVSILFISCPPPVKGYDLKIVSHNIPSIAPLKAKPIVIKFSEPLGDYTINSKNIYVDASYYPVG